MTTRLRHAELKRCSYQFLSIDTPGNRNRKGPSVLGRTASDPLMERRLPVERDGFEPSVLG